MSVTTITLDAASPLNEVVHFDGPGPVRVKLSDASPAEVVIANAESAQVTILRGTLPSVRIDRVGRLNLNMIGCRVNGDLVLREIGFRTQESSMISIDDVAVEGEFRLERAELQALNIVHSSFRKKFWLRRLTMTEPDYVRLTSCAFHDRVYVTGGFQVMGGPAQEAGEPVVDLRQNDFQSNATFDRLAIRASSDSNTAMSFRGSTFGGLFRLADLGTAGVVDGRNITAECATHLSLNGSPAAELRLDRSEFRGPALFTLNEVSVDAPSADFRAGGQIESNSSLGFEGGRFGQTTVIRPLSLLWDCPPDLRDVRRADVRSVTLLSVDLRRCRFAGAVGLDELTVETDDGLWPRRNRRRYICDEEDARAISSLTPSSSSGRGPAPSPELVASCYRQLRVGRESAKDEPGAADFYYGEMEMRRLSAARSKRLDFPILALYWATSGYGLKASRALLTLLGVVLVGGLCLGAWGIDRHASDAIWFGFLSSVEVATLRSTSEKLTTMGRIISIPLRLLAPLVFLQFVLALRSRIRR